MKRLLIPTLALIVGANCASRSSSQNTNLTASQGIASPQPSPTDGGSAKEAGPESQDVPREFSKVDFKNFSYPIRWKHQTVRLKDGHLEFFEDRIFYNARFDIGGVYYADLDGDRKKDAIVQLHWVSCGVSCDGGSYLFYFYQSAGGRPRLLSRIETGSFADQECGLKSLGLDHEKLVLETFQNCGFDGVSIKPIRKPDAADRLGKFGANNYTRFVMSFKGKAFIAQRREVFRWPQGDAMNYSPTINIKND